MENCLSGEQDRIISYVHPSSRPKVLETCLDVLVRDKQDLLVTECNLYFDEESYCGMDCEICFAHFHWWLEIGLSLNGQMIFLCFSFLFSILSPCLESLQMSCKRQIVLHICLNQFFPLIIFLICSCHVDSLWKDLRRVYRLLTHTTKGIEVFGNIFSERVKNEGLELYANLSEREKIDPLVFGAAVVGLCEKIFSVIHTVFNSDPHLLASVSNVSFRLYVYFFCKEGKRRLEISPLLSFSGQPSTVMMLFFLSAFSMYIFFLL